MIKALAELSKDPRVREVSDETNTGDGYWLILRPGWRTHDEVVHAVHEWNVKDLKAAFRLIKPCTCLDCSGVAVRSREGPVG